MLHHNIRALNMTDFLLALYSYALILSGLPPAPPPELILEPPEFFWVHACGGQRCPVIGWYPESGGNVIYVSDRLNFENKVSASIIVHEMVHYLQYHNQQFTDTSCSHSLDLERQAYGVQKEYLLQEGVIATGVGISIMSMHCAD
jgi:hypothetical protein